MEQRARFREEKDVRVAALEHELAELRASCITPVTRIDFDEWLDVNLDELRHRMLTAPAKRREINVRVGPREGLPPPVHRFVPVAQEKVKHHTAWAQKLAFRTGWYGLEAAPGGRRFFPLFHFRAGVFVIDLEDYRVGDLIYVLTPLFDLRAHLRPVAEWETKLTDAVVKRVFYFVVKGRPAPGGGVQLQATQCGEVTDALPAKTKSRLEKTGQADEAEEPEEELDGKLSEEDDTEECVDIDGVTTPEEFDFSPPRRRVRANPTPKSTPPSQTPSRPRRPSSRPRLTSSRPRRRPGRAGQGGRRKSTCTTTGSSILRTMRLTWM